MLHMGSLRSRETGLTVENAGISGSPVDQNCGKENTESSSDTVHSPRRVTEVEIIVSEAEDNIQ